MNEDLLDDFNQGTDELPQMLNVVTILTFIGSGLAILMSSYRLITKTKQIDSLNDTIVLLEKSDSQNFLMDSALQGIKLNIEHFTLLNSVSILAGIICIIGAILIRKLKKNGYYIYILGCILEIAIPAIMIGGVILGGMLLFGSIFSILFIILYGVNLKHLK